MVDETEDTVVDQTIKSEGVGDQPAYLDMSDEDFQKANLEDFSDEEIPLVKAEDTLDKKEETDDTATPDEDTSEEDTDKEEKELSDAVNTETDATVETDFKDKEKGITEEEKNDATVSKEVTADDQLKQLFSPFKANNREMQVNSIDDARQLMQMGANYNKKMAQLRPNLKTMKMLQNNDLLDEGKLSFLIDLSKHDPDAIKKLVKDSKIDLESIDNDDPINYKAHTTYNVNDKEIVLDETFDDIKDTDSYATTLDIISNKWDGSSRRVLLENPTAIRTLNDHVTAGHYEKITAAVDTERMFGRIPSGMSDLEAYTQVANALNEHGAFNDESTTTKTIIKPAKSKTAETVDHTLADRKKAASSTKGGSKPSGKEKLNPLNMSDEEFEKTSMSKFI